MQTCGRQTGQHRGSETGKLKHCSPQRHRGHGEKNKRIMDKKINLNRCSLAALMAMAVNIIIFTGYPNILPDHVIPSDLEYLQQVDFINDIPDEKPVNEVEKEQETFKEKQAIPQRHIESFSEVRRLQPDLDIPDIEFPSAPAMDMGITMAKPVSKTGPVSKEFYNMGDVDQTPQVIFKSQPDYPYRARRLNLDGDVDIKFLVDKSGNVTKVEILKAAPPGIFEQNVIDTVSRWRFEPGMIKGRKVNTWMITTIEFRISDL